MSVDRSDALLKEYGEVASSFRLLTEIRFKLLAFLPVAAAAAAAVLAQTGPSVPALAFSLFGLAVTLGLVTYNARNDQLYNTLVGRAAAIERSLGIPEGAFAHRPRAWLRIGHGLWHIDHGTGVATIYYASIGLWVSGVLATLGQSAHGWFPQNRTPSWVEMLGLFGAIGFTALGAYWIKRGRRKTEKRLRVAAAHAVNTAQQLVEASPGTLAWACQNSLVAACDDLTSPMGKPEEREKIEARATFLAGLEPAEIPHYVAGGSTLWRATQVVAIMTDHAPEWLHDCATSRRLRIAEPAGSFASGSVSTGSVTDKTSTEASTQ